MGKRRISMFEAFGASARGAQGPKRSATQRAIDLQRGVEHTQHPAERALERLAPSFVPPGAAPEGAHGTHGAPAADGRGEAGAEVPYEALLEALRSAATAGAASEAPPRAMPSAFTGGTPGAAPEPRPASRAAGAPLSDGARAGLQAPEDGFTLPFGWVTFLCLQLGLFAVAFGLGTMMGGGGSAPSAGDPVGLGAGLGPVLELPSVAPSTGRVPGSEAPELLARGQSGGTGSERGDARAPGGPGGSDRASGRAAPPATPADPRLAAFLDPANLYAVQVESYDGSPNSQGLARHWEGFLRERGFDAVLREVGTRLALFVGASPNRLEMEELQRTVGDLRDARGARIFTNARVVELADFR